MYLDKIRAVLYHRVKTARICYLLLFFSGLWQYSGRFGDHGSRSSQKLRSVSSICFGISVRRYSKYSYGFRLFALAVSAMLYMMALDFAPAMVSIITQFFFPIQKPRIDCSAALLSIETSPSSRNTFRYFSWLRQYMNPS